MILSHQRGSTIRTAQRDLKQAIVILVVWFLVFSLIIFIHVGIYVHYTLVYLCRRLAVIFVVSLFVIVVGGRGSLIHSILYFPGILFSSPIVFLQYWYSNDRAYPLIVLYCSGCANGCCSACRRMPVRAAFFSTSGSPA